MKKDIVIILVLYLNLALSSPCFAVSLAKYMLQVPIKKVTTSSEQPKFFDGTRTIEYDGNKAIDGDLTTRWSSDIDKRPQWITADLSIPESFFMIVLLWETAAAEVYRIETSNDNECWRTIWTNRHGKPGVEIIQFTTMHRARYIRIYCQQSIIHANYSLYEFQIYRCR